ncbi:hypothetical protein [Microbulbifer sediminum]|uniref:hypothetical protein n=1 Tax=Microbulbifer sediminum TaxID=2904250 RepID=UPI001F37A169|nr:hypothetical protein [Microbulbifer sediminum]
MKLVKSSILFFLILSAGCSASTASADVWSCYSPTASGVTIEAVSKVNGEIDKIKVPPVNFICLESLLSVSANGSHEFVVGVPFKYIKNRGEYKFRVDPKDFTLVTDDSESKLRDFEEIKFSSEDGGDWGIFRSKGRAGFVQRLNDDRINLSAGINNATGVIYFFNLNKEQFNYQALYADFQRKCVWSEWPGISKLVWGGWKVCEVFPGIDNH